MVIRCAVYGCKSSNRDDERLFYPFPKDELRCSAWVEALDRPELYRISAQELHDDYRVCDLHFIFLDHHKILLDDSVPCIIVPKEFYLNRYRYTIPQVIDDAAPGVSEPQEPIWKDIDIPDTTHEIQSNSISIDDGLNKSTQTDFIKTLEMACQTEHELAHDPWKAGNTVQLLTTVKCEVLSNDFDYAPGDAKLTHKNDVESLMCQPDLPFIMSEDTKKTENSQTQKEPSSESPCKTKAAKDQQPEMTETIKSTRRLRSRNVQKDSDEDYVPIENIQTRRKRSCRTTAAKNIQKQDRNTKPKPTRTQSKIARIDTCVSVSHCRCSNTDLQSRQLRHMLQRPTACAVGCSLRIAFHRTPYKPVVLQRLQLPLQHMLLAVGCWLQCSE
ncbi:THAP domain-containing protein [Phthorimaea operculella]|nr:THAP domain-containing protein [Phthorimaea operculella]